MKKFIFFAICLCFNFQLRAQDSIPQIKKYNIDSVMQAMKEQERKQAVEEQLFISKKLEMAPADSVFQLKINRLYFRQFPDISRFKNITSIDAETNEFTLIKKSAFASDSLKRINLEGNELKHIHFPKNKTVKSLVLNRNEFKRIPRSIKKLENLQNLEITNNQIKRIPHFLKKNKNLTSLDLNYNQLHFNKKTARRLVNISTLHLGGNELAELPENIGELKNLRKLNLGKNKLSNVPASFMELDSLNNVIFYQNNFSEIPEEINYLKNLVELDFYYNSISIIPSGIGSLTKLKQLFLSYNQIKILPDTLRSLSSLKYFFVHHNDLTILPEWIGKMSTVERMDISYNHIISIPNLSEMTALSELNIEDNVIENFPWELIDKPNMKLLIVRNNNFILSKAEENQLRNWKNEIGDKALVIQY